MDVRLLAEKHQRLQVRCAERRLASSIADANHRCKVTRDRVLQGVPRIGRIHVNQRGISRHRAGPFEVQIAFLKIAVQHSGIRGSRHEHDLRILCRQAHQAAEFANITDLDIALSHNGNTLACAVDAPAVQRLHGIDQAEIRGRQKMVC